MKYALYFVGFGFGGALMLYALLLRLTLNVRLIPRNGAAKIRDPKNYAKTMSHILIFLALALISGGWVGLYAGPLFGTLALVACLALAIWLCVRLWRSGNNKNR